MSNKTSKEIECISRLESLTTAYEAMLDFMQEEALISKEERKMCHMAQDKAKWIWTTLAVLSKTDKLQLLEYEWLVLPVERLKITIITDRNHREFSYGY